MNVFFNRETSRREHEQHFFGKQSRGTWSNGFLRDFPLKFDSPAQARRRRPVRAQRRFLSRLGREDLRPASHRKQQAVGLGRD